MSILDTVRFVLVRGRLLEPSIYALFLRLQAVMGHGLEQKQANKGFQVIEQGGSLFLDFGGWSNCVFIGDFALIEFGT